MTTEAQTFQTPELSQIHEALQKANSVFDEVAFLGNSLPLPQTIEATLPDCGRVNISTFPQKLERAELAFISVTCMDTQGVQKGTLFLAGSAAEDAHAGEWNWSLTSRPGMLGEASDEAKTLAGTFLVPLAKAWESLGAEGQDRQISEWRRSISDRKSRRIAAKLRQLRRPHAA